MIHAGGYPRPFAFTPQGVATGGVNHAPTPPNVVQRSRGTVRLPGIRPEGTDPLHPGTQLPTGHCPTGVQGRGLCRDPTAGRFRPSPLTFEASTPPGWQASLRAKLSLRLQGRTTQGQGP